MINNCQPPNTILTLPPKTDRFFSNSMAARAYGRTIPWLREDWRAFAGIFCVARQFVSARNGVMFEICFGQRTRLPRQLLKPIAQ